MHMLKHLCEATVSLAKQARLVIQSVAIAVNQKRRQIALHGSEAERLDRIRNPSKFLGK